jgi:hypothetical protein
MPLFDPDFLFVLIALAAGAWLIRNRLRERQGQSLPDTAPPALAQIRAENEALRERLAHCEDRLQVLERIVTDSGHETARRIEALRHRPDGA